MKLIVSCFSCSPSRGSEPGMGWGYLRAIASHHDIWALVDGYEFEEELRCYQAEHPEELKRVHFVFVPCKPHPILRKLWPPSYYWFYNLWHRRAYRIAKKLHKEIGFDAAWKLSMVTYREPGYLWKLPIPFVWGPVGALGLTDWRLLPLVGLKGGLEFAIRNVINWWQSRLLRRPRLAARKADQTNTLFAATGENAREMKRLWRVDSRVLCEIGLSDLPVETPVAPHKELRIFWSGLFERRKALPLLLRALSKVKIPFELHVLGDGALKPAWQVEAKSLGVSEHVVWHGWKPRTEALAILGQSDVAIVASIHDLTSTVLVEAIAHAKPVICLDHCGFADVIDETCGIKVRIDTPSVMVKSFASAIERLYSEGLRRQLSVGARKRALDYVWTKKTETLESILKGAEYDA